MFNWQMPDIGAGIILLIIWETFWKGIGLWKSAKKGDTIWFVAIFLINLFGLVPLVYLWRSKQLSTIIQEIKDFFKSRFQKK